MSAAGGRVQVAPPREAAPAQLASAVESHFQAQVRPAFQSFTDSMQTVLGRTTLSSRDRDGLNATMLRLGTAMGGLQGRIASGQPAGPEIRSLQIQIGFLGQALDQLGQATEHPSHRGLYAQAVSDLIGLNAQIGATSLAKALLS